MSTISSLFKDPFSDDRGTFSGGDKRFQQTFGKGSPIFQPSGGAGTLFNIGNKFFNALPGGPFNPISILARGLFRQFGPKPPKAADVIQGLFGDRRGFNQLPTMAAESRRRKERSSGTDTAGPFAALFADMAQSGEGDFSSSGGASEAGFGGAAGVASKLLPIFNSLRKTQPGQQQISLPRLPGPISFGGGESGGNFFGNNLLSRRQSGNFFGGSIPNVAGVGLGDEAGGRNSFGNNLFSRMGQPNPLQNLFSQFGRV